MTTRSKRLKRFGLTEDDYDDLLESQGGVCRICGSEPTESRSLAVDHDHADGTIRGLLCFACNVGIGHLRDSPHLLRLAADYIEAAANAYPDHCTPCADAGRLDDRGDDAWVQYPVRRSNDGKGGVVAAYCCKFCGHMWPVWWSPRIVFGPVVP